MSENKLNKIDFAVIIAVERANPNGDPLNGNRPRQTSEGLGEISDVCLKRKIRNRLLDMGESIFVQSDDYRKDDYRSLKARYDDAKIREGEERTETCKKWFDVRAFGQVFAFKKKEGKKATKKNKEDDLVPSDSEESENGDNTNSDDASGAVSIGIRGPVTIQGAYSIEQIIPESLQITKSVNLETEQNPDKKGADTMGMKHRVEKGIYVTYGSINPQLAKCTGFSADDAMKIQTALRALFINDETSARPAGSMEIKQVIWWEHNSEAGQYSSAKVHHSLKVKSDGTYEINTLPGLTCKELEELSPAEFASLKSK